MCSSSERCAQWTSPQDTDTLETKCILKKYCGVSANFLDQETLFNCPLLDNANNQNDPAKEEEIEDLPPVKEDGILVDWDGNEVDETSWYSKSLYTIPYVDVEVNAINMTIVAAVIISVVVLCCCYCSWRNKKEIVETTTRLSSKIRKSFSGGNAAEESKYQEAAQVSNRGMASG